MHEEHSIASYAEKNNLCTINHSFAYYEENDGGAKMKKIDLRSLKRNPRELKEAIAGIDPNTIRQVQHVVQQYQGRSEAELMEELRQIAARERTGGNLPDDRIDKISELLSPMLAPNQQEQMQAIIQQLKGT